MNSIRIESMIVAVLLLVAAQSPASAGTVVSGSVSGTWDQFGSPYWVEGDLTVSSGNTLDIQPGVEVRFRGPFRLMVNGLLDAVGSAADSILFTRDEPIPAHDWRGIRLVGADDASKLAYCVIEHVRSADDYPEVRGGAIYCQNTTAAIRRCDLRGNVSHNGNSNGMGGGVACVEASPLIEYCIIRDNEADSGGGIATIEECTPIIRNNRIENNLAPYSGGGIYAGVRSSPVIECNTIVGNTAHGWGGGGITLWNWYAVNGIGKTVRNNVVANNTTTVVGGGFYIRYDFSALENNTVVGNHAAQRGGGAYVLNQGAGDFPPQLRNWILWDNTAGLFPAIYADASTGSVVYVTYSDVEGGWAGAGNIDQDPQFLGPEYLLNPASDCIDAGNPSPNYEDLCFPPSQGGARNDMGAYGGPEACGWQLDLSAAPHWGAAAESEIFRGIAPNPFRAATRLHFALPAGERVTLSVYDISGRRVRALLAGSEFGAGDHFVEWDGRDEGGRRMVAGVYLARMEVAGRTESRRLVVLN